jgi:hypothetical protein
MTIDPGRLLDVHRRLCDGDPAASADLIQTLYGPLIGHAIKKHRAFGLDDDGARDLALGVLVQLIEAPQTFDPKRGNLFGYLCMSLDGDAKNHGQKASNRDDIFSGYAVEVEKIGGNTYEIKPDDRIDARRIMELHANKIVTDDGDQAVLELYLADESDYRAYADALGIAGWPQKERDAEVKRRRDRIEKRLQRLKDKL